MTTAGVSQTLASLMEGNARYRRRRALSVSRREGLMCRTNDSTRAAVLVCSDLRIDPERLFDVAPGQLYVMQTPANVIAAGEAAGAMLAHRLFGVDLTVVVGHTPCCVARSCGNGSENLIAREVATTRRCLRGEPSTGEFERAHVRRMAEVLRARLRNVCSIAVFAALLDDMTGRVVLVDDAHTATGT